MSVTASDFDSSYYNGMGNYSEGYDNPSREVANKERALVIQDMFPDKNTVLIDYGCATGILLNQLRNLGYNHIQGFDISTYSIDQVQGKGLRATTQLSELPKNSVLTSFDVFEHMTESQIEKVLKTLEPESIILKVPTATCGSIEGYGDSVFYKYATILDSLTLESFIPVFTLPVSRNDKTHINLKTDSEWIDFLANCSYRFQVLINEIGLYNKEGGGVFTAIFSKIEEH